MKSKFCMSSLRPSLLGVLCFFAWAISACESDLSVSSPESKDAVFIEGLDRLAAKPGEIVEITGKNLQEGLWITINDKKVEIEMKSPTTATFTLPMDSDHGLLQVAFYSHDKNLTKIPLMNANSVDELSTLTVPLDSICDSLIFKNETGELVRGRGHCGTKLPACTYEGQTACKATGEYPAISRVTLASKILAGQTAGGVMGQAVQNLLECTD